MDLDSRLAAYQKHTLNAGERHWPETNCYIDLWIGLLYDAGLDPVAGLGFTIAQAYEGDQFTFGKYIAEDLEALYGFSVRELAIYHELAAHLHMQVRQGRVVLLEVDAFHLPDTIGLTYRREHSKTTIGVQFIDPDRERLGYFHNSGFYALEGEDYRNILSTPVPGMWPYAELVGRRGDALRDPDILPMSVACFRRQIARMPAVNPIAAWRKAMPDQVKALQEMPAAAFHRYAFNHMRQLGANFELMASYLQWLAGQGEWGWSAIAPAMKIAEQAKTLQFRLARLVTHKRQDPCNELMDQLEESYARISETLRENFA